MTGLYMRKPTTDFDKVLVSNLSGSVVLGEKHE